MLMRSTPGSPRCPADARPACSARALDKAAVAAMMLAHERLRVARPDLLGGGASPPPGVADGGAGRRAGLAQGPGVDRRRHGHPSGLARACRLGCRPAWLPE